MIFAIPRCCFDEPRENEQDYACAESAIVMIAGDLVWSSIRRALAAPSPRRENPLG
jgi:hypothetical protein